MPHCRYNHISINARDFLEETREFYEELFGAEMLQMPNMGTAPGGAAVGYWLKMGDLQLHLIGPIKPGGEPVIDTIPKYQHTAVSVDDFAEFYYLVRARDVPEDDSMWGFPLNVLPSGQVQYYVRDPAGNLVEVNCDDASVLPEDILERAEYQTLRLEQTPEQLKASLFLKKREGVSTGAGQ